MNKTTAILIGLLTLVTVGCLTLLIVTDHDATIYIASIPGFLGAVFALAGYDKAKNAEANSATTVTQTNGRMTELTTNIKTLADAINNNPNIPVAASASDDGRSVGVTSTLPTEGTDNGQPAS